MEPVTFAWLLSRGIRLDDRVPSDRQLAQLAAVREARREANRGLSPFARLARRLGLEPARATPNAATCSCPA